MIDTPSPQPKRIRAFGSLITACATLAGAVGLAATVTTGPAHAASSPTTPIWSTQLDFDSGGAAWSESYFAGLAAKGLTTAELNMPWGTIEPSAGTFSFTIWDQELANAAAAGIQLIPVFWSSGWSGSPAPWITDLEKSSTGAAGQAPDWWNSTEQSQYFTYVENTIQNSLAQPGGYGGAILNYGYLDAQWDINGSGGGYTTDDIAEFQNVYLPDTYGTIATFNSDEGTSYTSFSQVPAQASGQPLFGVFQAFRAWSVEQTYGALTAAVRKITASTPLYYYYGGGFGNVLNYANNPDTFFKLAKQYNVAIIADSASNTGMTLAMASLAQAYGVKMAQEWTAPSSNSELAAYAVQWIGGYGLALPQGGGEDFFIHDGTPKDTVGFPIYTKFLPTLKTLSGSYPQQPVALYIDVSQGYGNTSGGSLYNVQTYAANIWRSFQSGLAIVTSQEVANGAVSLSSFHAVLPLNGVDANLTSYKNGGGTLLGTPAQLPQYAAPYAQIDAPYVGDVQTVPTVSANRTSAAITMANITTGTAYNAPIAFSPAGLGLASGSYYLVDAATGAAVPQSVQSNGLICAGADIPAATLAEWTVKSGSVPAGTATSGCPATYTGATSVSSTAGQPDNGLSFQHVGGTNKGADGNLTQITQSGQTAYETWTTAQSGANNTANAYLQLAPMSAVEAASNITLKVTYWAAANQGFTVQYSTPTNPYQNGPTVTSPGTGTWATATVQLTGAELGEQEAGNGDLRLAVTTPTQPLIVRSATLSVTSNGPVLAASPSSVSFGAVNVGSTSPAQTVTISNTGNAAATISGVSASSGFAQTNTCGSSLAAGASCTAGVTFSPTAGQAYAGNLTVNSNAAASPLTVALTGTGGTSSTNLALKQPISASSVQQNYVATNANDGNTSSYWESSDGTWPSTLTVDLGSAHSLTKTVVDLPPPSVWQTRTQTLSVLGSNDDSTWTTAVASATYTWNPASGNTVTIDFPSGSTYRYVQLKFTANSVQNGAQVSEWQIFG